MCTVTVSSVGRISKAVIMSLEEQFGKFCVFGVTGASTSGGPTIALSQIDKWFKQAKVFNKKFSTTDTGICFGKLK